MPSYACKPGCNCKRHSNSGRPKRKCEICNKPARVMMDVCVDCHRRRMRKLQGVAEPVKTPARHADYRCICGHIGARHRGRDGKYGCTHEGCKCRHADSTNPVYFAEQTGRIKRMGFITHLNETATCSICFEPVEIGKWYDPLVFRRALNHIIERHPQQNITSPNRAKRVG